MSVFDTLKDRGFVDQHTSDDLREILSNPIGFYLGIDPTADCMHIGHLVGVVMCMFLQKAGHTPHLLVGGATGLIGDPSFKDQERPLLTEENVHENVIGLTECLKPFLDFEHPSAKPRLLNNYDWFSKMSMVEYLRDVGKHFRVGPMMGKDSVRTRLSSDEGMSYTEFSYQLLQGYDFYHLNKTFGVSLEIGGSDQFGNITAGIDYTRRMGGGPVHGLTFPLLTRSDGKKFGKSEKGAIWLKEELCSPFEFFQYLYRTPDDDVEKMFSLLTMLDIGEIKKITREMKSPEYSQNSAQKRLAEEVTRLVHGEDGLTKAQKSTDAFTPGKMKFDESSLEGIAKNVPSIDLMSADVVGKPYVEVIGRAGLVPSKGAAKRLIQNMGAYLNSEKVTDIDRVILEEDILKGNLLIVSSGKKNVLLINLK